MLTDQNVDHPVFKTNLQDHLHHSNRSNAAVIEECIRVLSYQALTEEVCSVISFHLFVSSIANCISNKYRQ